jgi:hypothetical protein
MMERCIEAVLDAGHAAREPETVTTISRRISKLEERFVLWIDRQGRDISEVLRERLRRYLAQQGLPPEPAWPLLSVPVLTIGREPAASCYDICAGE